MLATGIVPTEEIVAANTTKATPATPAEPFEESSNTPRSASCCEDIYTHDTGDADGYGDAIEAKFPFVSLTLAGGASDGSKQEPVN
jgi:hypothetical protein